MPLERLQTVESVKVLFITVEMSDDLPVPSTQHTNDYTIYNTSTTPTITNKNNQNLVLHPCASWNY